MRILTLGSAAAAVLDTGCRLRSKADCLFAATQTESIWAASDVCGGWCPESAQCVEKDVYACPLGEQMWTGPLGRACRHWNAAYCADLAEQTRTPTGTARATCAAYCLPLNQSWTDGYCSDLIKDCPPDTYYSVALFNQVPCSARTTCFQCGYRLSSVHSSYGTDPACGWCAASSTCVDTTCPDGSTPVTDTKQCTVDENEYQTDAKTRRQIAKYQRKLAAAQS